jgi:peptidoglycan/LPS O-acetylase OafA/YrhL
VISDPETHTPSAPPAERARLSLELVIDLVLCGVSLAGLSLLAQHLQPDFPRVTLFTGLVGGGLCVLCGVLGRRTARVRVSAMVTLAAAACVLVRQAVQSWAASTEDASNGRMVAVLMTVLVAFSVGMLTNLAREGKGPQP